TVGGSVAEAAWWFILLERSCREHVYAHSMGANPIEISPEVAKSTYEDEGSAQSGREQFQPLWEMITKEQPDLDRKSTRLNSSHVSSSYAVFCLKTKNKK